VKVDSKNGSEHFSQSIIYIIFCGIAEAEHCDDMLNPASEDMVLAQRKISEQIGLYLNNPTC
jgi:hypothetical protein